MSQLNIRTGVKTVDEVRQTLEDLVRLLSSTQGFMNIPLFELRNDAGGPIPNSPAGDNAGYELDSGTLEIEWTDSAAPGGTPDPVYVNWMFPPDMNTGADLVLHFFGAVGGDPSTDTPTIQVVSRFLEIGSPHPSSTITDTSEAFAGSADHSIEEKICTIASADVPAHPCAVTFAIKPSDGTIDTDDFHLYAIWIEYTRKFLTS